MNDRPCRACGVQLTFKKGPAGKVIPLHEMKNAYFINSAGRAVPVPRPPGGSVYVSHFETCPKASEFSNNRRD